MKKHFEIASNDPDFKKNFPVIPKIGYRRSRNLGELLIRAKLYDVDVNHVTRNRNGFNPNSTKLPELRDLPRGGGISPPILFQKVVV